MRWTLTPRGIAPCAPYRSHRSTGRRGAMQSPSKTLPGSYPAPFYGGPCRNRDTPTGPSLARSGPSSYGLVSLLSGPVVCVKVSGRGAGASIRRHVGRRPIHHVRCISGALQHSRITRDRRQCRQCWQFGSEGYIPYGNRASNQTARVVRERSPHSLSNPKPGSSL